MAIFGIMLQLQSFTFNPLQENTYILFDSTKECVIIDPGCYDKEERQELKAFIEKENLHVKYLLNTHCHLDHILGNKFIKNEYEVELYIHPIEKEIMLAAKLYASYYGMPLYEETIADKFINEGDKLMFGQTELDIMLLPGHSPGHVAFIEHQSKIVIGGDVLFYHSIGRTDLPGGNYKDLMNSIKNKLFTLGNEYVVYPGHGPKTTIGEERMNNPYL